MTDAPTYRVSRYTHSRIHPWQWRCLHGACLAGGTSRSEAEATTEAAEHARTHDEEPRQ
ncbi:hypothetical protein [Streptomyces coerulescens]|uniref:Uncharacterized protein n=1 Tax=Streptomyces coerulescens TaxID=29304 RepID=A0ABW0CPU1_STRCD